MLGALRPRAGHPRLPHRRLRPGQAAARPPVAGGGGRGRRRGRRWPCWRCSSTAARRGCRSPPRRRCPSASRSPSGGSTANLLVPLYLVVAAGARWRTRCRGWPAGSAPEGGRARRGVLEWALAAHAWPSTAIQSSYSDDFGHALENVVFFYVPFALLFVAAWPAWRGRRAWRASASACSSCLALALVGRRLRRVRDAPPVAEPEGHRLQPARGLLPRQLAVLRPEHLRALPRDRDAPARRRGCCGRARQREVVALGALLLAVLWGGLVLTLLAVELHRAARRPRGARGAALERALGADHVGRRARRRRGASWPSRRARSISSSATRSRPTRRPAGATT